MSKENSEGKIYVANFNNGESHVMIAASKAIADEAFNELCRSLNATTEGARLSATPLEILKQDLGDKFPMKTWDSEEGDGDKRPWQVSIAKECHYHQDGTIDGISIAAICPDGIKREVVIEINDGNMVARAYDSEHDEPVHVRIGKADVSIDHDRQD